MNTYVGEKSSSDIVLQAAKRNIPAGRTVKIRTNFPWEASQLAEQRDALRRQNPVDTRLKEMDMHIVALTNGYCRERWRQH